MACRWASSVSRTRSRHGNAPRWAQESTEMRRILVSVAAAALFFIASSGPSPQASAARETAASDSASLDELLAEDCVDDVAQAIAQTAAKLPQEGGVASDDWPPHAIGGVIPPIRSVSDPFPTFDGIALDPENDRVLFSDE